MTGSTKRRNMRKTKRKTTARMVQLAGTGVVKVLVQSTRFCLAQNWPFSRCFLERKVRKSWIVLPVDSSSTTGLRLDIVKCSYVQ